MKSRPNLVKDNSGFPIQGALRPIRTATIGFTTTSGEARLSGETGLARIVTTKAAYLAFGGATVNAGVGDLLIPANVPELFVLPENAPYVAFTGSGEAGLAFLTDLG